MHNTYSDYSHKDIQEIISESIARLDKYQQIKLLEFIDSIFINKNTKPDSITKYAGCIAKDELKLMKTAIKDCEKIDNNEW
mgnify:FL=1